MRMLRKESKAYGLLGKSILIKRPKGSALKPASLSGHDFRKRKLPSATALSCAVNKRLDLNFD